MTSPKMLSRSSGTVPSPRIVPMVPLPFSAVLAGTMPRIEYLTRLMPDLASPSRATGGEPAGALRDRDRLAVLARPDGQGRNRDADQDPASPLSRSVHRMTPFLGIEGSPGPIPGEPHAVCREQSRRLAHHRGDHRFTGVHDDELSGSHTCLHLGDTGIGHVGWIELRPGYREQELPGRRVARLARDR